MYNHNHRTDILIMRSAIVILLLISCASPGYAQSNDVPSNDGQLKSEVSAQTSEAVVSSETENAPISGDADAQTPGDSASDKAEVQATALEENEVLEPESESAQADTSGTLTPEEEAELMAALAADASEAEESKSEGSTAGAIMAAIQSMNPDMAVTGDFALAWFSEKKNYQSGAHDPTATGFQLQQLEMTLGASVDQVFRMDVNLVFSLGGVELEEAYVTSLGLPWGLQVRVGQFLSKFGRINPTHPHTWDFVDQPFVIGKFFGAEGNRGLGLELSWLAPLPWYLEVIGSAQMATSNASNRSYLGSNGETEGAQDFLYTLAIRQFFPLHDDVGLFWGLNAQTGPNSTGRGNRTNIFGTDLFLKYSPHQKPNMALIFQAEAMFRLRQVPRDLLFDAAGYAQIVWQIDREWATGVRGEFGSGVKNDPLDPFWTTERGRAALQVTWSPSHFSRLRAQASIDIPKWQSDPIYALMLALEFTAGTHPAHSY